jgi:hypothetical protein
MYKGDMIIDLTAAKTNSADIEPQDEIARAGFPSLLSHVAEETAELGLLHLYIQDFSVPTWNAKLWKPLVVDIKALLRSGTDVLVACAGGHGRTGVAVSIIAHMIDPLLVGNDPITWVREKYCEKIVENDKQIKYIFNTLKLGEPPKGLKPAKEVFVSSSVPSGSYINGKWEPKSAPKLGPPPPLKQGSYSNIGGVIVSTERGLDDEAWENYVNYFA